MFLRSAWTSVVAILAIPLRLTGAVRQSIVDDAVVTQTGLDEYCFKCKRNDTKTGYRPCSRNTLYVQFAESSEDEGKKVCQQVDDDPRYEVTQDMKARGACVPVKEQCKKCIECRASTPEWASSISCGILEEDPQSSLSLTSACAKKCEKQLKWTKGTAMVAYVECPKGQSALTPPETAHRSSVVDDKVVMQTGRDEYCFQCKRNDTKTGYRPCRKDTVWVQYAKASKHEANNVCQQIDDDPQVTQDMKARGACVPVKEKCKKCIECRASAPGWASSISCGILKEDPLNMFSRTLACEKKCDKQLKASKGVPIVSYVECPEDLSV